ncbi:serine/threonine-protein kinase MPS1 isoform X4 [Vitis vinifera]|uniref:serine/threonine-protein kinase MPS1 isoform X4 n=1 Tax=Vitis vinifera TaxID=29760 RepID=UPI00053F4BC7|nr:serine/threonine-protein kinase MPS1 isoform X4 [Vitis vinifera]|eukprot:XP_010664251.1 PREDICTED: serine/threonine-protein kinase mph1 isoform X4 [Vitis vinifera]
MDGEANLPAPSASANNLSRPILPDSYQNRSITSSSSSSSSSSSFYSSSPPDFLRHVQAAFKRHRPLGTMQSNSIMPRRILVPRRETSKITASNVVPTIDAKKSQDVRPSMHQGNTGKELVVEIRNKVSVVGETEEDAPITPPSISESQHVPVVDGQKKVQFLLGKNASSQEMEWDVSNQVEAPTDVNHDLKHGYFQNLESDVTSRSDGGISSLLAKKPVLAQDQLHRFRNFLQSDINHPMTQASVAGSSCATTISVHATSAPVINSTTYCSSSHQDISPHLAVETLGDVNLNSQPISKGDVMQPSHPPSKSTSGVIVDRTAIAAQASSSSIDTQSKVKEYGFSEQQDRVPNERDIPKNPSPLDDNSTKGKGFTGDVTDLQSQVPLSKSSSSDVKLETSKSEKQEKVVSGKGSSVPRKKNYDPDMFLKVNGKLYQRLGKIGSGGSSEVHKVISSDCSIYALKKIRLKGRDYATAYGFCQEIQYLNKLKGKSNIIQLIDYEVTDKTLLQEVMNGSMSNKDSRVKDDGCIYMVLEYGEIDLANMLSQKWKEMDSSDRTIDENWLRFYWQQILQAVNTIHEERIVHSDLKPANFLLVKGSLKLIDFGIAKAIMSDTTNIQRDSQVGTLSYMSPEAFMCNESDANGNTIKCGRPSDIWSLGCILYQMVYGRTPFSEFKTFWAKFKVITDRNHEIKYEPVSNPWLLDIMKKCLAWDRNERWRIPELLQHPFLVPPVPVLAQLSSSQDQSCKLLQLITEACANDPKALILCRQLQQLLRDPVTVPTSQVLTSRDQQCKLLSYVSKLCCQLQEYLSDPDT